MHAGFKVLDGDGHMQEPVDIWERYLDPKYRDRIKVVGHVGRTLHKYAPCDAVPEGRMNPRPESVFSDVPGRYGPAYESWWSLEARLAHMDEEGIDIMVGFPTNGSVATSPDITDPEFQAALCRAYNDWGADYCRQGSDRVKYIAKVSLLDLPWAVNEIERLADVPGVAAVVLPDPGSGRLWHDDEFKPLWQALTEADFAACFHGGNSQQHMFRPWTEGGLSAVSHALSFPVDSMLAMGSLIFGGVLEEFPDLRVGFYEANAGWLPWWLARMDDHAVGRQGRFMYGFTLPLKPSEYFRRQCFVAADADEGRLRDAVEAMDGDNLLFNTDYPHPDAPFPGAVEQFISRGLPENATRKILWDNSARLYGARVA